MSIYTDKKGRTCVSVMVNGQRIFKRLSPGESKGTAKQLEAEMRRAAGQQIRSLPSDPMLVSLMDMYMMYADTLRSPETAKFHALRIGQWLVGKTASEAQKCAQNAISDMTGHYRPATINRSLGTLKKAISLAFMKGIIPEDYGKKIKRLPENNQRHEYLTIEQVNRLANCASEQVRVAIWVALLTGCRRGEILKMTREDILGDQIRIRAGNTKTLRERAVPIVPALRPWLEFIPIRISMEGLKTGFQRARAKAGLPDTNFHDLRHSCASLLINMGTPLEVIRDILGHTSIKTTERYSHLMVDKQRDALEKLSSAVNLL